LPEKLCRRQATTGMFWWQLSASKTAWKTTHHCSSDYWHVLVTTFCVKNSLKDNTSLCKRLLTCFGGKCLCQKQPGRQHITVQVTSGMFWWKLSVSKTAWQTTHHCPSDYWHVLVKISVSKIASQTTHHSPRYGLYTSLRSENPQLQNYQRYLTDAQTRAALYQNDLLLVLRNYFTLGSGLCINKHIPNLTVKAWANMQIMCRGFKSSGIQSYAAGGLVLEVSKDNISF
jgi:hypothetical protein